MRAPFEASSASAFLPLSCRSRRNLAPIHCAAARPRPSTMRSRVTRPTSAVTKSSRPSPKSVDISRKHIWTSPEMVVPLKIRIGTLWGHHPKRVIKRRAGYLWPVQIAGRCDSRRDHVGGRYAL
jgi:hypothetical protein